jgi:DDE family transposase
MSGEAAVGEGVPLVVALAAVPDPRRPRGWRPAHPPLPLAALLACCVAGMLCGARSLSALAQWGRERLADDPALLQALGLPPGRSPCVATLHRVFKRLDAGAFERVVGDWLARTGLPADEVLAVDGKTLRGVHGDLPAVHLVALYATQASKVLAQGAAPGKGQELAATKQVLGQVDLGGKVVVGDALQTQRAVCEQIVAKGGTSSSR